MLSSLDASLLFGVCVSGVCISVSALLWGGGPVHLYLL